MSSVISQATEQTLSVFDIHLPTDLHPDLALLVRNIAGELGQKLRKAELKYGYSNGWADPMWMEECRQKLRGLLEKGDPIDIVAYCAFLWYYGEPITKKEENENKN